MNLLSVSVSHRFSSSFSLDCEFASSGISVLFGPSGAGKSTLLDVIAGLLRCDRGDVRFGDNIWSGDGRWISTQQRRLGYVMQRPLLFKNLDVAGNIGFALTGHGFHKRAVIERTASLLGLTPLLTASVQNLSGGEQQRVALARALAPSPSLLLLDEPFAALDSSTTLQLLQVVSTWASSREATVLYVTHDITEAWVIGEQVIRMDAGKVRAIGKAQMVLAAERDMTLRLLKPKTGEQ